MQLGEKIELPIPQAHSQCVCKQCFIADHFSFPSLCIVLHYPACDQSGPAEGRLNVGGGGGGGTYLYIKMSLSILPFGYWYVKSRCKFIAYIFESILIHQLAKKHVQETNIQSYTNRIDIQFSKDMGGGVGRKYNDNL